jgi:hypothetical protein
MNLAKNLEMSAFYFPERPAISEDGQKTSYPVYGRNEVQSLAAATEISCPNYTSSLRASRIRFPIAIF